MFAKDVELLNELYSNKIISELNLGPRGDQDAGSGLSPEKPNRIIMPPKRPCPKCTDCGEEEEQENCENIANHEETNSDMTRQSLYRLVKLSAMLHDLVSKEQNIEPWVLTKITEALNHVESVYGYMDYENYKHQVESDIAALREETEADLYNSIAYGGAQILSRLRSVLATESKENLEGFLYETISVLESKK